MERKILVLSIIIPILILIGLLFSPPDHQLGRYKGIVSAKVKDDFEIKLVFHFRVVSPEDLDQKLVSFKNTSHLTGDQKINITILAYGYNEYPLEPGSKADFEVVIYVNGEPLLIKPTMIRGIVILPNGNKEKALILSYGEQIVFRFAIRYRSRIAIITLLIIAFLWLSEIIPLVASALLVPVIAVLSGILTPKQALSPLFDPVIALFFGGFLLARAMRKYDLDKRIALTLITRAKTPGALVLIIMLITCFLSFWMSNTAVAALMLPISLALLKTIEKERGSNYGKLLVLGVAYSATVGGMGTIIGTPPNALAVGMLEDIAGIEMGFLDWMILSVPFTLLLLFVSFVYLYIIYPPRKDIETRRIHATLLDLTAIKIQIADLGRVKKEEKITAIILIATVSLWITQKLPFSIGGWKGHGVSAGIIALCSTVALFSLGILDSKDLKEISWETLLIFGGGLVLGEMLVLSGVSEWIVAQMLVIREPFLILILLGFLSLIITAFASNTAAAVILLPLAIPIGSAIGINPIIPALVVAIATSTDFALPIGTPPTMLAYSTGYLKFREIVKVGFPLMIIGILLLTLIVVPIWMIILS